MTTIGAPNTILAQALLQGPQALQTAMDADPTLFQNTQEVIALNAVFAMIDLSLRHMGDVTDPVRGKAVTEEWVTAMLNNPPDNLFAVLDHVKHIGFSLFSSPADAAERAIAALTSAKDDLTNDPDVGDRAVLAMLNKDRLIRHVAGALFALAHSSAGLNDNIAAKALTRLVQRVKVGDGRAATYVLAMIPSDNPKYERKGMIGIFTRGHVRALEEALRKPVQTDDLTLEGGVVTALKMTLNRLRQHRPELFSPGE